MGDGPEFFLVSATGIKRPNKTITGAILTITADWCSIPILFDSINRTNRISLSHAPYRQKSLIACNGFTLLQPNESYVTAYEERGRYPATLRPAFPRMASMFRSAMRPTLSVVCQVSIGLIAPVASLILRIPAPVVEGSLVCLATTLAFVFDFPFRDVAQYTMPALNYALGALSSDWPQPMSTESVVLRCFFLLTGFLSAMCARGAIICRVYPDYPNNAAPTKPLSRLITADASPTSSADDRTSGCTIDQDNEENRRGRERRQDGLFASVCDARCVLINGDPSNRLNKNVCKMHGVKLVTLLSSDEL